MTVDPGASERITRVLIGALIVLTGLLVAQGGWWVLHSVRADPAAEPEGEISVPAGAPVRMEQAAWREGVAAAAEAARVVVTRDYQTYDAGVEEAVELMTPDFAQEYRAITAQIEDAFVSSRTVVEVRVVGQGVVRAGDTELEALVFLDRRTTEGRAGDRETTAAPYRAKLSMVHTDEGWLVDDIQTR